MTRTDDAGTGQESLRREAWDWILRLSSGDATAADIEQMRAWRARSTLHADAFAQASGRWHLFGSALDRVAAKSRLGQRNASDAPSLLGRRALLRGAAAASIVGLGIAASRPPLGFWPSLGELAADYRTAPGEQRRLTLDDDVSIELNTRTSVNVARGTSDRIELVSGEVTVLARSRKVELVTGDGRTAADLASFNVRGDGGSVCVTCLDGSVEVSRGQNAIKLRQNQQVIYSAARFSDPVAVDASAVTGWRDGDLHFDDETLASVIEEINRYRAGRIFLMNDALGRKRITAHFKIAKLDLVIGQLQAAYGVHARQLPGGITLLS